jgi:4-amino-4-deoxy-L-arabinose transferase-like glycosyltransferase
MNLNKKRFDSTYFVFFAIAVIYAIGNFIWWQMNTPIIPMHISALHFLDILREGWLFRNAPLLTWIMRGMFYIFGKEYYDLIVIFVNYIFFLIPLYFIYKIGVELKDKETGNIAMILFALVPAIYGMSRQYGHKDYHIIAGITFNIYCLIKTDYFKNRKWAIWYGISVGLGLMIKDSFLAYFFIPFAYIVIVGLKEKTDKTKIINILTAIALGCLIAGWHYFKIDIIKKIWYEPVTETVPVFIFDSLRVMTIGLWEDLLSPPIFIIFIIGLIFFIWKYRGKYKYIILLWFFVPWSIIMLMPHHKLPEYGVGFIPAIILISVIWISNMKYKYIKKIIFLLLIVVGILQYVNFS